MRALTDREKRTIRWGAAALAAYLVLFTGLKLCKGLEEERREYWRLVQAAELLKLELERYEIKTLQLEKLQKTFHVDVRKVPKPAMVAQVSAAIQQAAQSGGLQVGPIRESPGSRSAYELAVMQFEGTGQVPNVVAMLHQLETLGFPIIVESAQLGPDTSRPGNLKLNLTVVILDFDLWKGSGGRHV